jgi:hypothetical protein
MSGTRRTPIGRHPREPALTVAAIRLFDQMMRCKWDRPSDVERWWRLHNDLCRELNARPWEWPVIEHPDETDDPDPAAQALWLRLETASRALRAARRKAKPERPDQPSPK